MPPVQPQPVLAPLTPAAIFLVVTIDDGGEATVHDALPGLSGLGARDRFPRPDQTSVGGRLDRLRRLGPVVRRASLDKKARRTASVRRAERTAAHRAGHARRPAVPHSGRDAGRVLRIGRPHPQVDGRRGDRRRRSARLQVLRQPRPAGLCRRHRKPGRPSRYRAPPRSATRIPTSPARCYVHVQKYVHDMPSWDSLSVTEQERVIGRTKLDDIEMDDDVKPSNSHIALNVIEDDDGNELKIVRPTCRSANSARANSAPTTSAIRARRRSPNGCCATCSRRSAGQHRPHPGFLHRGHRRTVLLPHRRLPRRSPAAARAAGRRSARRHPLRMTAHFRSAA